MKSLKNQQFKMAALCWMAYSAIYFGRVNFSVAILEIQAVFGWTKGQVGFIGSLFFWIYGIGQLINGQIGDKISARHIIFLGLAVTSICNLGFGMGMTFGVMAVIWSINSYAQSTLWGPIVKSISNWFQPEGRGRAAIYVSTSMVGGYLLAWGLSGAIISKFDWRFAFWIPGVTILACSIIWFVLFKNKPEELGLSFHKTEVHNKNMEVSMDGVHGDSLSLVQVIHRTKMYCVVLGCFVQGVIKDGIALWAPSLFMETQGMDLKSATQFIIFIPVMNFVGILAAGLLNKKLKNQEKLTTSILFGAGILMIVGFIVSSSHNVFLSLIFLGLSSATMFGANTILLGVLPMNYSIYNKTSSVAGFLDFTSYLAAGTGALVTGLIVDTLGWNTVLICWIVFGIIGISSLLISHNYDRINGNAILNSNE